MVNKKGTKEFVALWDERKHAKDLYPVIVYRDKDKGYVVGHNKFEMLVQWEDEFGHRSIPGPCSSLDGLTFEFEEDHTFFTKLFNKGTKTHGNSN